MSVFTKATSEITFADIDELMSAKTQEGWMLDYKGEWIGNDEIAKLVCAFANTYGGLIVFGIAEEKGKNTPGEFTWFECPKENLGSKIDSITWDKITPPVFCETKVVGSADGKHWVFVVRVPESDLTPHAVMGNRRVYYVKVNEQKRPFPEEADLDEQQWLLARRAKHESLRRRMCRSALSHAATFGSDTLRDQCRIETVICPRYPRERLIGLGDLYGFLSQKLLEYRELNNALFDMRHKLIPVNDGFILWWESPALHYQVEFNVYGLCHFRHALQRYQDHPDDSEEWIYPTEIARLAYHGLLLPIHILEGCGYRGSLLASMRATGLDQSYMRSGTSYSDKEPQHVTQCRISEPVTIAQVLPFGNTRASARLFIHAFLSKVFHIFDVLLDAPGSATNLLQRTLADSQLQDLPIDSHVLPMFDDPEFGIETFGDLSERSAKDNREIRKLSMKD